MAADLRTRGPGVQTWLESQSIVCCERYADDGVAIDLSREAAVQMNTTPDNPATVMVSFFQRNLIGFRVERFVSWASATPNAQWTTLPALS